ncbi:hypothetical protein SLEP1_g31885 [Rubroshorea leprosula]|uniref:Uncharacterized protein n=1 Tax=Rubroshorea leprosula TaxID=152421 RepID=A0AAV5KBM5_9ROSI|nr:hypothetical protein SLEP1_g31885 [Rubroshorea leprosula]
MLWELVYTELFFAQALWPNFGEARGVAIVLAKRDVMAGKILNCSYMPVKALLLDVRGSWKLTEIVSVI